MEQLTKTEKSGMGGLFGNALYFSHIEFEGTACATRCAEKLLFIPVELAIGLRQCYTAVAWKTSKKNTDNQVPLQNT